ncbi:ejaculatory bulb-specific protein 3-like [Prorops nasuta]|uniref:ejaculatory bulb-specific protein 3-like n=1 Tax=Prorops nasuta TaxID=863751 RepID=UPI0034CE2356
MELRGILILIFAGCGLVWSTEYYSDIYDKIDVDSILSSDRLLKQYINCLLDEGPCTADGRSLRRIAPEALATRCEKCTEKQKAITKKVLVFLMKEKPDVWQLFLKKYDPDGVYTEDFEEFLLD